MSAWNDHQARVALLAAAAVCADEDGHFQRADALILASRDSFGVDESRFREALVDAGFTLGEIDDALREIFGVRPWS